MTPATVPFRWRPPRAHFRMRAITPAKGTSSLHRTPCLSFTPTPPSSRGCTVLVASPTPIPSPRSSMCTGATRTCLRATGRTTARWRRPSWSRQCRGGRRGHRRWCEFFTAMLGVPRARGPRVGETGVRSRRLRRASPVGLLLSRNGWRRDSDPTCPDSAPAIDDVLPAP